MADTTMNARLRSMLAFLISFTWPCRAADCRMYALSDARSHDAGDIFF